MSHRFLSTPGAVRRSWPWILAATIACGDSSAEQAESSARVCRATPSFSAAELAAPAVSFDADVAPVFVASCSFTACHASKLAGANHGIFLAAKSPSDTTAVKTALATPSKALPSMPYVTPGDPENSFLMKKLDGDLCALDERCTDRDCGKSMPSGNEILPADARTAVRRWIAQGAK